MTAPARDYAQDAQDAAEAHWLACQQVQWAYDETGDLDVLGTSPAVGPGCMECDTCMVREVLAAAWPVIAAGFAEDLAAAGETRAAQLLRYEAVRMALPTTPTHGEGVHA